MQTKAENPSRHLQGKDTLAIVELYFEFCHLKQLYRRGWLQRGIAPLRCESVAEHSFGVAMLAMFIADQHFPDLDTAKIMRLALLHDFGEIDTGDMTPKDQIPRTEKVRRERACVVRILRQLPGGDKYVALWEEYEEGHSAEARFVRQVEKLEMALQASVYEHQKLADLTDFFASARQALEDPPLRQLLAAIEKLRDNREAR
jgi:putative hydrolase of HD superfamily